MKELKYQAKPLSKQETKQVLEEFQSSYNLSFSSLRTFLRCPRLFWFSAIRKLEFLSVKIPFVIGNHVNLGLHEIYKKNPDAIKDIMKDFKKVRQELLMTPGVTPKTANEVDEAGVIIRAMLKAYMDVYKKEIKKTKHVHTEFRIDYKWNDQVHIKGFIDNVLMQDKSLYVHEVKTTQYLTDDYIKRIQIDMQTHMYFYFYNILNPKKKMSGIIYDVLRKPSIRISEKKGESQEEFLGRLTMYYEDPQKQAESFYMETIEKPFLKESNVMNTIGRVVKAIESVKSLDDLYQNQTACYVGNYPCNYFSLCHSSENALSLYGFRENRLMPKTAEKH
jgi:hypothetical protein